MTRSQLRLQTPPYVDTLPRLINAHELAALLGVSEREAYRVGSRVPCYRVGRMRRWNPDEVLSALREEPAS